MLQHHREVSRHLWHAGSPERGIELVGKGRLVVQLILSTD
jgi:hypothetical protein